MENKKTIIELSDVSYLYEDSENYTLKSINLKVHGNELVGIVGNSGSGKSTLCQILNGISRITKGTGKICEFSLSPTTKNEDKLWSKVGLVMQCPDHQMFCESVYEEIAFGLRNKNFTKDEINEKIKYIVKSLDIDENLLTKFPFHLSGGEKKLVTLASILIMEPEVLIMDEPTLGLDYQNVKKIFKKIKEIHKKSNTTIIIVSHDVKEIIQNVDRLIVMREGEILIDDNIKETLKNCKKLENYDIILPTTIKIVNELVNNGIKFRNIPLNPKSLAREIKKLLDVQQHKTQKP